MDTLDKIFLHQIAAPGLPGGIDAAEAAAIRADQAAILARPVIDRLAAIPDVTDDPVAGETLVWDPGANGGAGGWVSGTAGGSVEEVVQAGQPGTAQADVHQLVLNPGLRVNSAGYPGGAILDLQWGLTGDDNVVARDDHTHEIKLAFSLPFDPSGSLSSGNRPLASGTLAGLDPTRTYRVWAELKGEIRGEGTGAGRSYPHVSLHGYSRARFNGTRGYVRTVAGVDREYSMQHPGILVGTITSIGVAANLLHVDGDPKYVGGGELVVHVDSNR